MDSFELNKLIGAFLGAIFVMFSVSLVADALFSTHAPEQPGYVIEAAEDDGAGAAPQEEGPSVMALLADADASAGETAFRRCVACHTPEEGGANRIGPNLWDIVNRPIASKEGFSYSNAMREFSEGGQQVWDWEHLSGFLRSPRNYVPGTSMAFAGISNPQEEANLIAYLGTLSNDPAPLPEVTEEEEAPAEGEEATGEDAATEDDAATEEEGTDVAPAQPDVSDDDGTAAGPTPDAGQPAGEDADTDATDQPTPEGGTGTTGGGANGDAPAQDEEEETPAQ